MSRHGAQEKMSLSDIRKIIISKFNFFVGTAFCNVEQLNFNIEDIKKNDVQSVSDEAGQIKKVEMDDNSFIVSEEKADAAPARIVGKVFVAALLIAGGVALFSTPVAPMGLALLIWASKLLWDSAVDFMAETPAEKEATSIVDVPHSHSFCASV